MSQPACSDGCPNTLQMGPWVLEEYIEARPPSSPQYLEPSVVVTAQPNCGLGTRWIPPTQLLFNQKPLEGNGKMRTTLSCQAHLLSSRTIHSYTLFINPAKPTNMTGCVWQGKETVALQNGWRKLLKHLQ